MIGCLNRTVLRALVAAGLGYGLGSWGWAQVRVDTLSFEAYQRRLQEGQQPAVVNFWATWCRPCVAELPYFEQVRKEIPQNALTVWLVSLDSPAELQTLVQPFVHRKKLRSEVSVLNETNDNHWMPRLHADWSGVLPVTVVYAERGQMLNFRAQPFESTAELKTYLRGQLPALEAQLK